MEKQAMNDYTAAADIGGTSVKLALFADMKLAESWEIATDISDRGRNILPDICESLKEHAAGTVISGIGMGIPGAVDEHNTVRNCTNIGWAATDLNAAVRALMPDTKYLAFGNDASVAALGELCFGAGMNYKTAYFMTIGTGVGGGFAAYGSVLPGANGAAGEIGHILINPRETFACMCGRYGCLEQYASANGIVRLAHNLLRLKGCTSSGGKSNEGVHIERLFDFDIPDERSSLEQLESFDSRDIFKYAEGGDRLAELTVELFGKCLGLAMSSISCSVDPEVYIIGGGVSRAGKALTDAVKRGYMQYAYPPSRDTKIVISKLGNQAGIYGCAAMVSRLIKKPAA